MHQYDQTLFSDTLLSARHPGVVKTLAFQTRVSTAPSGTADVNAWKNLACLIHILIYVKVRFLNTYSHGTCKKTASQESKSSLFAQAGLYHCYSHKTNQDFSRHDQSKNVS